MEWKFRKDFQVMPGIKLQYGKKGIHTAFTPPANYDTQKFQEEKLRYQLFKPYQEANEIKSAAIGKLTSESLKEFKSLLLASNSAFEETSLLLHDKTQRLEHLNVRLFRLQRSIFKFLFKSKLARLTDESNTLTEEVDELKEQLRLATVSLTIDSDDEYFELYDRINKAFELLIKSNKKWDFTSSQRTNMIADRTSASESVTRSEISVSYKSLPILKCAEPALCFHNMNGGDLYLYPGFMIVFESKVKFDVISYVDLNLTFKMQQFIETEAIPEDAKVVGYTWHKVNKDGSPDRRFNGNFQIPIALYGNLEFTSGNGLKEVYCLSNVEYTELFAKAVNDYVSSLKLASSMLGEFH